MDIKELRIGVIIPDRGDRPEFLQNCMRMLEAQTLQPTTSLLINDPPISEECDITWRYRTGYNRLKGLDLDIIFFIENDDWYSPIYIETMATEWVKTKPQLLGTNYTRYYHLFDQSWFIMNHVHRSAAMNTVIKADLDIQWPADNDPYTDLHLWMGAGLEGYTFAPNETISIGMKHGIGKCGGKHHTDQMHRYLNKDRELHFLINTLDIPSLKFYAKIMLQYDIQALQESTINLVQNTEKIPNSIPSQP